MIDIQSDTQALIFDCDGTLVDSMPLHRSLWNVVLKPYGVQVPEGYIDHHAGKPTEIITQIINAEFGVEIDPKSLANSKQTKFRELVEQVGPIDPVVEVARHYHGKLPMAVVSGGCRHNVELSLKQVGIYDLFPVILTSDDPITPKPAPDLFLAAAEKLGADPKYCHAFEDADAGVTAAQAAGMFVTDVRDLESIKA